MPVYEFRCSQCDNEFEELVRAMGQTSDVRCPSCGGDQVNQKLSVFGVGAAEALAPAAGPPGCGQCGQMGACPYQ